MNKKVGFIGLVVVLLIVGMFVARARIERSTSRFIENASIGNQFEIMSSQLVLQKSKNKDITDFAQQMIDDHTHVRDQMMAVLTAANANLPQPSDKMDAKHQMMLDKLGAATGDDFDRLYIDYQVSAHNEAVSLFNGYAQYGDNDALKNFAASTLPTLQQHQQHVNQMKAAM